MKKINDVKFDDLLPEYLRGDKKIKALSKGIESVLNDWVASNEKTLLYKNINNLPEELIILLLDEWHVDFVDDKTTLKQKRKLLKNSFEAHTKKGTVDILESTVKNIFGNVDIIEWFNYGGEPYLFKLIVEGKPPTPEEVKRIYKAVEVYKNVRSHLDGFIASTVYNKKNLYSGKLSSIGRNIYK